ncbi:hypothetical protein L1887_07023 [Cichorium endivia]|nr:hypothetical protein L1887_07023 [Cichorium endivia]
MTQMQGIVSILGSDNHEKSTRAGSLRRTLSADMSSKRWLAENGFSVSRTLKKIASSEQIAIDCSSSEEDEEECETNRKGDTNPRRIDIWTAIMSQKAQDDSVKLPPPYVHPLVKKSASSLSEKSLKVCTESLGSETGSDVFSSYPSSETGEKNRVHENQEQDEEIKEADAEEQKVVKHPTCLTTKKSQQARSLPPPLSSLAAAHIDGPSLHMHSHRVDGRLVLEAVTVPQQNYFEAQRQAGRFLLTLINDPIEQASEQDLKDVFRISEKEKSQEDNNQDEDEDEIESNFSDSEMGILKVRPPNLTNGMIKLHKSMVPIKRITERDNENPSWSRKLNAKTANLEKLEVVEEEEAYAAPPPESPITQSLPRPPRATGLPPLPPPSTTTSFNSYQYFWRAKPTVASVIDPLMTQHRPPTKTKDLVLLRGNKADCLLPSLRGCKEPRRSLLMWEPFCIATS